MEVLLLVSTAGQPGLGLNHLRRLCPALFSLPSACTQLLQQQPTACAAQSHQRHAARQSNRPHGWQRPPATIAHNRGFSSSTHSSLTEAASAADPQAGTSFNSHSSRAALSHLEMSDTLTLAAAIRRFRSRGHLVSQVSATENPQLCAMTPT